MDRCVTCIHNTLYRPSTTLWYTSISRTWLPHPRRSRVRRRWRHIGGTTSYIRTARGATTGGVGGSGPPPQKKKNCLDPSNFLDNFFHGGSNCLNFSVQRWHGRHHVNCHWLYALHSSSQGALTSEENFCRLSWRYYNYGNLISWISFQKFKN